MKHQGERAKYVWWRDFSEKRQIFAFGRTLDNTDEKILKELCNKSRLEQVLCFLHWPSETYANYQWCGTRRHIIKNTVFRHETITTVFMIPYAIKSTMKTLSLISFRLIQKNTTTNTFEATYKLPGYLSAKRDTRCKFTIIIFVGQCVNK